MATVTYLKPSDPMPELGDDEPWLFVEPFENDGKFYGTGGSHNRFGEWVGYASLPENDVSFEKALAAAHAWADEHGVPIIYVRTEPQTHDLYKQVLVWKRLSPREIAVYVCLERLSDHRVCVQSCEFFQEAHRDWDRLIKNTGGLFMEEEPTCRCKWYEDVQAAILAHDEDFADLK